MFAKNFVFLVMMKATFLFFALFFTGYAFGVPEQKLEEPETKKPIGTILLDEEADEKAEKKAVPAANLVKVKKGKFETDLTLNGVIESKENTQIRVIPKTWSDLTVQEVVPHGTKVKKGDIILRFETEKLVRAIEDEEAELPLAKLKLESATAELESLEKKSPLELDAKRKSKIQAEDDFAYFEEVRRPMNERAARERLKSYQNYLSYSEEELRQLKKMYENDDMTEETEEIILKRAQDSVNGDKWNVEQIKVSTERALNVSIPREHETLKRRLKLSQLDWEGEEENVERTIETKRLEVEQQERSLAKSSEKLADLKSDLDALIVEAPHDGIVYYGATNRGKWITASTVEKKLIPGGRASAREVLLTLVNPGELQVRVAVAEDKLRDLREGKKATLTLKWNDENKMDATVKSISYVPDANATFDSVFSFDRGNSGMAIFPGMNAKLVLEAYRNDNALTVPIKAVKKEGDKSYVIYKDGKKVWVETGRADKTVIEIKSGLKEGDEIKADLTSADAAKK